MELEHGKYSLALYKKGAALQLAKSLGREYVPVHGPYAVAPRKREALTPSTAKALIRELGGLQTNICGLGALLAGSWLTRNAIGAIALPSCRGFRLAEVTLVDSTAFSTSKMS